jgi:glycine/D-amino acid oxidase-like deaminating enzyme
MHKPDVLIVGSGVFGISAALELTQRHYDVCVLDPGPVPHPLAASTDISKIVRIEYGTDSGYTALAEQCLPQFHRWNEELGEVLYHPTGVLMITRETMAPGGFEFESYRVLRERGHHPERLGPEEIQTRFPAWSDAYVDGFYHPQGGYVESGRLISALARKARADGVRFVDGQAESVDGRGVTVAGSGRLDAGLVVVAAGAWTPTLVPALRPMMRASGHPVFHLKPEHPERFASPRMATFTADVSRTGWYGFPLNPREGVVKVANHGVGLTLHPENDAREVYPDDHAQLRSFLKESLPELAGAPVVYTRRCLYCDTLDEHFWIDHHPDVPGLFVATGGSGHGFKFAPVLGGLIADAIERKDHPMLQRFAWRDLSASTGGQEAARYRG